MSGIVVWFTGLPASGKSCLAERVRHVLAQRQVPVCILDGDEVRQALVPRPGYDGEARDRFYGTLARMASLLAEQGLVVLVPATAHRRMYRDEARALAPIFVEVYMDSPIGTCERRDVKGLYDAAHRGGVDSLPGVQLDFEAPTHPEVIASGGHDDAAQVAIVTAACEALEIDARDAAAGAKPGKPRDSLARLGRALEDASASYEALAATTRSSADRDFIGVFLRAAGSIVSTYQPN